MNKQEKILAEQLIIFARQSGIDWQSLTTFELATKYIENALLDTVDQAVEIEQIVEGELFKEKIYIDTKYPYVSNDNEPQFWVDGLNIWATFDKMEYDTSNGEWFIWCKPVEGWHEDVSNE